MKIIKDKRLKYVDEGNGEAIILLHGLSANPHAHKRVIKALSSNFRVIAPFIKLFRDYERVNKQMKEILDELGIEKAMIIGHSAGGILAMNFANEYPEKVSSLILVGSPGVYNKNNFLPNIFKRLRFIGALLINHPKLLSISTAYTLKSLFIPRRLTSEMNFVINYSQEKINFDIPTLILWSTSDKLILEESIHELNKLIPGSKLEFVQGDHNWLMTNPEVLAEKIKEFINL